MAFILEWIITVLFRRIKKLNKKTSLKSKTVISSWYSKNKCSLLTWGPQHIFSSTNCFREHKKQHTKISKKKKHIQNKHRKRRSTFEHFSTLIRMPFFHSSWASNFLLSLFCYASMFFWILYLFVSRLKQRRRKDFSTLLVKFSSSVFGDT